MIWYFPESILLTPVGSEAVLLDTATGNSYVLSPLGLAIAALIEEGQDTKTIIHRLEQQFPNAVAQIPQDVAHFLAELQREGLLTPELSPEGKS